MPVPAQEALRRLRAGNERFIRGASTLGRSPEHGGFVDLSAGQEPIAAVLACSDSRVPVELIMDQGPGQIFVVRVAGNVAGPTQVGSLEFAVDVLQVGLVLVLGHSYCGAVAATLEAMNEPQEENTSHSLGSITDRIATALGTGGEDQDLSDESRPHELERNHARVVARQLVARSGLLAGAVESRRLQIVASLYHVEDGRVEILDDARVDPLGASARG